MSASKEIGGMLADQVDRLLTQEVDRDALLAMEAGQFPDALRAQIEDLGATLALVPEAARGAGLRWQDVEGLLRTLGRHSSPVPLGETIATAALLSSANIAVPDGPLALVAQPLQLASDGRVSGQDSLVAWAPSSRHLVGQAERNGRQFLVLIQRDSTDQKACSTYGRIPSASVLMSAVRPVAIGEAQGPDVLSILAVLRASQIAGALQEVLMQCIDYANTRQQFGKPIGKFQAIQQHLAELALHAAATQVAALYGCRSLDAGTGRRGAAIAKIRAGTAAGAGAKLAHQIFGAIGITDEHRLHYYTRRLWQWRGEAGSERAWAEELGQATLDAGSAKLWATLVS